jgi:hypothetical protein
MRPRPMSRNTSPNAAPAARLVPLGPAHAPPALCHHLTHASCPPAIPTTRQSHAAVNQIHHPTPALVAYPAGHPTPDPSSAARRLTPGEIYTKERERARMNDCR